MYRFSLMYGTQISERYANVTISGRKRKLLFSDINLLCVYAVYIKINRKD